MAGKKPWGGLKNNTKVKSDRSAAGDATPVAQNSLYLYDRGHDRFIQITDGFTFGRNEGNETFPKDTLLSRQHVRFSIRAGDVYVTDLGSTNRTRVNSALIEANADYRLELGNRIDFGNQSFLLTNQNHEPPTGSPERMAAAAEHRRQEGLKYSLDRPAAMLQHLKSFLKFWKWDVFHWLLVVGVTGSVGYGLWILQHQGWFSGAPFPGWRMALWISLGVGIPAFATLLFGSAILRNYLDTWPGKLVFLPIAVANGGLLGYATLTLTPVAFEGMQNAMTWTCLQKNDRPACLQLLNQNTAVAQKLPGPIREKIALRYFSNREPAQK